MGTRSITHIHSAKELYDDERVLCSFLRHWDGYPSVAGQDLANWLKDKKLVNGMGDEFIEGRDFNRAGTIVIPLMMHIQSKSGAEVIPIGADDYGEEYTYDIFFRDNEFIIKVTDTYTYKSETVLAKDFKGQEILNNDEEQFT